jgi:hypothetical protein
MNITFLLLLESRCCYILGSKLIIPFQLESPILLKGFPERLEENHDLTGFNLKEHQNYQERIR